MIYGKGINDMPKGWKSKNEKVYRTWHSMLARCYSEKFHKKYPTYKECFVCEKWLKLSGFLEDLPKIENYDLWLKNEEKYDLDKDIKSDNANKCYCLEECMFALKTENIKQSIKHRTFLSGEKHPMYGKGYLISGEKHPMYGKQHKDETKQKISKTKKNDIKNKKENHPKAKMVAQFKNGKIIKIWKYIKEAKQELKIDHISDCCRGVRKNAGGYEWKYICNCTDEELNEYIIHSKQFYVKNKD